jgi:hypothetical protein
LGRGELPRVVEEMPVSEVILFLWIRRWADGSRSYCGFGVDIKQAVLGKLVRVAPVLMPGLDFYFRHGGQPVRLILALK